MKNCLYKQIICILTVAALLPLTVACDAITASSGVSSSIIINEVVSSNKRSLVDTSAGSPDWIELYNASDQKIQLKNYGISDNLRNLHKYVFPDISIEPGGYLVIYAGDNNGITKTDVPCTGFGLSKSGDYLFLTDEYYGVVQQIEIPQLYTDVSYARRSDGSFGFCATPTPGAANTEPIEDNLESLFGVQSKNTLTISEVMPTSESDGNPWVELFNSGDTAIQLDNYYLSDSEANVMRWQMPQSAIMPGEYVCIWLSGLGTKATSGIHSDFKLGKTDTCVILADAMGNVLDQVSWEPNISVAISVVKTADGTAYTAFSTFEKENSDDTFTELKMQQMKDSDPVHISEVLKKNSFSAIDTDGDRSEWVELVNISAQSVPLHGYFLSDDEADLYKWALPDSMLPAGAYLLIFLSGKDRTEGELHASFRLGDSDNTLYLTTIDGMKTESISLIEIEGADISIGRDASGRTRYYAQPTPGYQNAQGFETAEEIGCFNKDGIFISEVSGVEAPKSKRNDWIELYNGGNEAVDLSGWCISDDAKEPQKWQIPSLVIGAQRHAVIEATSHVVRQNGSVATFGIGGGGDTIVLSDPEGHPVDIFETGALSEGITVGRVETDSSVARVYFRTPTKGEKNSADHSVGYASQPILSETGLYHAESFEVTLACCNSNAAVYYTLDGSTPTVRSQKYEGPISITGNTVLSAASFQEGLLPSETAMATYLFDEPHTVPVVCINGDPQKIKEVMRVDDKDEKVERAAIISFYETDGTLGVTFPAGIKPKGAGTVGYAQKSLSLNLRSGYGQSSVTYPFFPNYGFKTFAALVVRNAGQDWQCARMRDPYCQKLVMGMHLDYSANRLVVVYVNGKYNGLYDLGEDQNKEYLTTHYGVDGDQVDVIRRNSTVISGDNKDIKRVRQYALDTDLSQEDKFKEFSQWIDVDYFTDYFIAQTYFCNSDMFNQKYWRSQDYAVKWRPIFYDLDFGFKNSASRDMIGQYFNVNGVPSADESLTYFEIYIGLKKNAGWRDDCLERYVECVMTYFNSERATRILDEMVAAMKPEMPRQIEQWGKPATMRDWEKEVAVLRKTAEERPNYALESIQKYFGASQETMDQLIAKYKDIKPSQPD
ncbi:MAG: lamin tail domain-containing protein [Clostridia bacterium]